MANKNYNKMAKPKTEVVETVEEPIAEVATTENVSASKEEPKAPRIVMGKVVDCTKLNVREKPNKSAKVVAVIEANTVLGVNEDLSTDGWYAVKNGTGKQIFNGFCMKEYIKVKP